MQYLKFVLLALMCGLSMNSSFADDGKKKQGLASDCVSIGRVPCCKNKWIIYFAGNGSGWCSNPLEKRAKVSWSCTPNGPIGAVVGSTMGSVVMGPHFQKHVLIDSEGQTCRIVTSSWVNTGSGGNDL